ncbi:MAG: ATP-binding protein [Kiritimatiellae bacterium]|nr:ATP-binding protein [Kiritimatiellia bacterium]
MIERRKQLRRVQDALSEYPVAVLLGARQVGKTTLARQMVKAWQGETNFFDLEIESGFAALTGTPEAVLLGLRGLVVIDEIQRLPKLFATLRPLADRTDNLARFLLLGSASPSMIKGVSESLAGRADFVQVTGLTLDETGENRQNTLWLRGGFPRSFLAGSDGQSLKWRRNFITAQVERDIPLLGIQVPSPMLRRFWNMLAHYHGQIWNAEELGRSLGVTGKTVRHYLDILAGTFLVRVLPPWSENLGKRQVKSPKVYVRDSGLLHAFLGIETMSGLQSHPKYGASWEGFAMEQVLAHTDVFQPYFWATSQGAEVDLLLERDGRRMGIEFKCADAPAMTKSIHVALADLRLDRMLVVYPGDRRYSLHPKVTALPLSEAVHDLSEVSFPRQSQ